MSLSELDRSVRVNLELCITADMEGRPEEKRERLCKIQETIIEFLGETNAVDEKLAEKEETQTKPGHCQPDQKDQKDS